MSWIERSDRIVAAIAPVHLGHIVITDRDGAVPRVLEELIASAAEGGVVRAMSPVVDDDRIVEALLAARERGVEVRMLTALLDRHRIVTKGWDGESSLDSHAESLRRLAMAGVLLRSTASTPHGKLLQLDEVRAAFGSANLAAGSLRKGALEAIARVDDPALLIALRSAFDAVWRACPFKMAWLGGSLTLTETAPNLRAIPLDGTWRVDDTLVTLSMPGGPSGVGSLCAELVESSRSVVLFAALSFYGLDEVPRLGDAIADALRRGVRVLALVRPEHFKPDQYPEAATRALLRLGLELRGVRGLHAKGFSVDDDWCAIHSANFNPFSLDARRTDANVELAIIDRLPSRRLDDYGAWLRSLWENATHTWVE